MRYIDVVHIYHEIEITCFHIHNYLPTNILALPTQRKKDCALRLRPFL